MAGACNEGIGSRRISQIPPVFDDGSSLFPKEANHCWPHKIIGFSYYGSQTFETSCHLVSPTSPLPLQPTSTGQRLAATIAN
jgi:hypothetical protein